MGYALVKMIHVGSIILSYLLFLTRGIWMMQNSAKLQLRWVKILPHITDTVLLASAIYLAILLQQDPLNNSWLSAKVIGLLLYICLGMVAMRFGKTRKTKIIAWIAAQCVFAYIVLVALTKSPTMSLF